MSSTNRSAARDAHISDFYITPQETIRSFLAAINEDNYEFLDNQLDDEPLTILDPCAGGDAKNPCAYPTAITASSGWKINIIDTVDIRQDSCAAAKCDFLTAQAGKEYDVIITNPPFNIAMDIIRKSLHDVKIGGVVIMLLRLNFFGSKARQAFFQEQMPVLTYVHTKRPKFLNTGGTDSIEYMHCVWRRGQNCRHSALRVVD